MQFHGLAEHSKRLLIPALLKADLSKHKIRREQFRSELQSVGEGSFGANELFLGVTGDTEIAAHFGHIRRQLEKLAVGFFRGRVILLLHGASGSLC